MSLLSISLRRKPDAGNGGGQVFSKRGEKSGGLSSAAQLLGAPCSKDGGGGGEGREGAGAWRGR